MNWRWPAIFASLQKKPSSGQPEVTLGIIPGFAGTQRLPRLVGKGIAKELIYTGDMIDAQEAPARRPGEQGCGLRKSCCRLAKAMAQRIMSRGMFAVQTAKAAIHHGLNTDLATGSAYEASLFGVTCATDDKKEGMTAFVEKRKSLVLREIVRLTGSPCMLHHAGAFFSLSEKDNFLIP